MLGDTPPAAELAVYDGNDGTRNHLAVRLWGPRLRRNRRLLLATVSAALTPALCAAIAEPATAATSAPAVSTFEVIQMAVFVGVIGAALLSAIWLIRERGRTSVRLRSVPYNAPMRTIR